MTVFKLMVVHTSWSMGTMSILEFLACISFVHHVSKSRNGPGFINRCIQLFLRHDCHGKFVGCLQVSACNAQICDVCFLWCTPL